jgi:Tfp pilus assembly protein PilX
MNAMHIQSAQEKATLRARYAAGRHERGLVLMIALIVLIAMSLAAVALVRSVDTANVITGNLSFRGGAVQESDQGVEAARVAVTALATAGTDTADSVANNYYATVQANTDTALVALFGTRPLTALDQNARTGNTVNYIVERMCSTAGTATIDNCTMFIPPGRKDQKIKPGEGTGGSATPYYRVTVLVTGPRNTRTITQTMFYLI